MALAVLGAGPAERRAPARPASPTSRRRCARAACARLRRAAGRRAGSSSGPSRRPARRRRSADQNFGTSLSDSTRSRLLVALRSTSLQGWPATISSLTAQVKIALTAASDLVGQRPAPRSRPSCALTSARVMLAACSLPQRGSAWRRTSASACRQLLFRLLGVAARRSARPARRKCQRRARPASRPPGPCLGDLQHRLGRERAGVGKPDGAALPRCSQRGRPWWDRCTSTPALRSAAPGWQARAEGCPTPGRLGLRLELAHRQLGQPALERGALRSGHGRSPANPRLMMELNFLNDLLTEMAQECPRQQGPCATLANSLQRPQI